MRPMRTAAWRDVPPPGLSRAEQRWIVQADSLTQALSAVGRFRVICLQQNHGLATVDEWACLGLPRRQRVWQRDVLLLLNETPVIFAHTILPAHATTTDWPGRTTSFWPIVAQRASSTSTATLFAAAFTTAWYFVTVF